MATDIDAQPVFLAKSTWEIGYLSERFPQDRLRADPRAWLIGFAAVYGEPPRALADPIVDAIQCASTLVGSERLEDLASGSLRDFTILAPAGNGRTPLCAGAGAASVGARWEPRRHGGKDAGRRAAQG